MPVQIGHFKVLSELGRGGMGIVYKVKNAKTGALCALKMIPPEALSRADSELRFKREFRAMQRVEHPNVIRVFDAGTHDGCPFFTMELVEGSEIRRFLDGETPIVPNGKDGPPNVLTEAHRERLNAPERVKTVADLTVQVAFALAEIHSHRIVHRDLKPDNIIVSRAGVAKLMDFGIAKQLSSTSEHSTSGMVVGTFKYLSPEQALGGEIDGRADLYCLGIILYELLNGRHPFYSENSVGYAYHHAKKLPPDMEKLNPGVHPGLKAVCERLIKKDPRERYATAEDVVAAIREAVDGAPAPALETSTRQRAVGPAPVKNLPFDLAKDQLFAPAHVGRDEPMRLVAKGLGQLQRGRSSIVVINGRSGLGKTRLTKEADTAARESRIDFVWGRCVVQGTPYHPFVEILNSLVGEIVSRPADELKRLLGDDGRVLARYVPAMERLDIGVRPRPAALLEPEGERLRFLSVVSSFVGRMALLKPRVLVLDDLHLADEPTLALARHLVETMARAETDTPGTRGGPVGIVAAIDPSHPQDGLKPLLKRLTATDWNSGEVVTTIALQPLPVAAVRELLASMIGGGEVAEALAEYLQQESGGIPGVVEERVRAWVESGELRRSGPANARQWVFVKAAKGEAAEAPRTKPVEVRAATRWDIPIPDFNDNPNEKRVARLGEIARDVAERVAVVGERIHAAILERVALRPETELLDALDELIKRSILVEDNEVGGWHFVDADDRKALLKLLPESRQQHLHLLAARAAIDQAHRTRRPTNPDELASHYLAAHEPVLAIEQLAAAARAALAASATQTAAQRVREAQELLAAKQKRAEERGESRDPRLLRVDVDLVLLRLDVLAAVNEHRECVTLALRRLPRMQGSIDGGLVAELLLRMASSERMLGELDAALEHTAQVLSRTERGGSHALRCRAKALCGAIYEQRGNFALAERYYADAQELAHTIGDEIEEERARWAIAARRLSVGDLDEAQREFDQLLRAATARGEKLRITNFVNSLGVVAHERNDLAVAENAYRHMIELAKPAGDRRSLANALTNIAVVRRDMGDHDDAIVLIGKSARILKDLDQVEQLAYLHIVESQVHLERAVSEHAKATDNADALRAADEALAIATTANAALRIAEAAMCRGLAMVRLGQRDGRDEIARGIRTATSLNVNRLILFGALCEVETLATSNAVDDAVVALDAALARAHRTGFVRFEKKLQTLQERLQLRD